MKYIPREKLIDLSGDEAYDALKKLWIGEIQETAEQFTLKTGENYEQSLVDYLTSIKYKLDRSDIELVINRFNNDSQFYELAHFLLAAAFDEPVRELNKNQQLILQSLCEHEHIWSGDGDLVGDLTSLGLPINKKERKEYIHKLYNNNYHRTQKDAPVK